MTKRQMDARRKALDEYLSEMYGDDVVHFDGPEFDGGIVGVTTDGGWCIRTRGSWNRSPRRTGGAGKTQSTGSSSTRSVRFRTSEHTRRS